jgi:predicted ester cyclase
MNRTSVQDPKALIRRMWDLENGVRGDNRDEQLGKVMALLTDDYEVYDITLPEPIRGMGAWRAWMDSYYDAFPDLRQEENTLLAEGTTLAAEVQVSATHSGEIFGCAPTGRVVTWPVSGFYELSPDGERLRRFTMYFDLQGLVRKLGSPSE